MRTDRTGGFGRPFFFKGRGKYSPFLASHCEQGYRPGGVERV